MNEEEWGDLEYLYKACQSAITDGGLFRDIGVGLHEQGENERQSEKWQWNENR